MNDFSILITSFNRKEELEYTLYSLKNLISAGVKVIVCDDASTDGTSEFIEKDYPEIQLFVNPINRGLIYSRNLLMSKVQTTYAISIDDDANFLNLDALSEISKYFEKENKCGVISFRIYWGKTQPEKIYSSEVSGKVKSFVGCGHAWRMKAWREIPDYPAWYRFYGEENFASFQLFKKKWEVHYLPTVLVHHRVDNKERKKDGDYYLRARSSLRADWYNYIIFYPSRILLKVFLYSIKSQIVKSIKSHDIRVIKNNLLAFSDLLVNSKKLIKHRNSLTQLQYQEWKRLPDAKIYWRYKE